EPALVASRAYVTTDLDPDKDLKGKLEPFYKGQFLTKKGSGIKSIADLKGKTFCFTDPTSTSGTIIPQIVLKYNGINPDKDLKQITFAGSHPNVAAAVYKGDCDAGATFIDVRTDATLQKTYPDIMDKTEVFFVTIRIPNDGVQFVKDFDPKLRDATVNGLLAMMQDPGGKAMVRSLYGYDAFEKVQPTFYDEFRDLMVKAGVDPASFVK
ncbi:MAG: phosphate/phosphite/phosphonate ABC transporter substrate-binding protein, partial [Chloroflexi bacterium]|nr:phosphate/phosphite/phosphonate ABC transporter substrate-binding protein [Chloroflexota bacterium]